MDEAGARRVWLVRAFERADPDGRLLPHALRTQASREARETPEGPFAAAPEGEPRIGTALDAERFLARRAVPLKEHLEREFAPVQPTFRLSRWRRSWPGIAALVGVLLGLGLNALGPSQKINILSFPMLGLVAWNLGVYVILFFASRGDAKSSASLLRGPTAFLARVGAWFGSPERPWLRFHDVREGERVVGALRQFLAGWLGVGAPLHAARLRQVFHLAAAALMAGAVLGMYVRGFALAYTATWGSTFLDAEAVRGLFVGIFGPAAAILGREVPGVDELENMKQGADVSAALWIHFYAVTALIYVIVPRLLLAGLARRREHRLERGLRLPIEDDLYFVRLLSADRGEGLRAQVRPYSYKLGKRASEHLQSLLLDLLGNRAVIQLSAGIAYGGGESGGSGEKPLEPEAGAATCEVVVFNLAQTPEQEVQGQFLDELRAGVDRNGAPRTLLVVLDETAYRRRLSDDPAALDRLAERRRSWMRLLEACGLRCVFLELDEAPGEGALKLARAAVHPRAPGANGGNGTNGVQGTQGESELAPTGAR